MYYIKQIAKILNVNEMVARKVFERMVLDFSEASQEAFEREARFIYNRYFTFDSR